MKLTRRQLISIICEQLDIDILNTETGEIFDFGTPRDGWGLAPPAAWPELQRRLGIEVLEVDEHGFLHVSNDDFNKLDAEVRGKRRQRSHKKEQQGFQLHDDIVAAVTDAVLDTALLNMGKDRMNIILTGIDIELETREMNGEEVNFSDIDLEILAQDILWKVEEAEEQQPRESAPEERIYKTSDVFLSEGAKITRSGLRRIIHATVNEAHRDPTARHQSELSFAQTNPPESKKALQQQYWGQHRGPGERKEIEAQLASMGPFDLDTIGDLVPIGREAWENLSGVPAGDGTPPEKERYLERLAWDIVHHNVDVDYQTIDKLAELSDAFMWYLDTYYSDRRADEDREDAFA